eukprot:2762163-Rhodomonas_salina.1
MVAHRPKHRPDPSPTSDLDLVVGIVVCQRRHSATPGLLHAGMLRVLPHRPQHHPDPSSVADFDLVVGLDCKSPNCYAPGRLHPGMLRVLPHGFQQLFEGSVVELSDSGQQLNGSVGFFLVCNSGKVRLHRTAARTRRNASQTGGHHREGGTFRSLSLPAARDDLPQRIRT